MVRESPILKGDASVALAFTNQDGVFPSKRTILENPTEKYGTTEGPDGSTIEMAGLNLVPRVSPLSVSLSAPWYGKRGDPGNEVGRQFHFTVFHRNIQITQNTFQTAKRKSRAFNSGSNKMADVRLAVGVWDKIGDKFLVEILRFAVIMEFFFQNEILN